VRSVRRFAALLSAVTAIATAAQARAADFTTFTQGQVTVIQRLVEPKALDFDVVVPASLPDVWTAFTTPEGMATWLAPSAKVDLRKGGDWLALFKGVKPGGGSVIDFQPNVYLSISAMAPERFPNVRHDRTTAVFEFSSVDDTHTRVHLTQTGWKTGKEWDDAFDYLAKGNAQLLNALYQRFATGPVDWSKVGPR
jgi:uncharacterized protein YndB with AHSA1/START domain